MWMGGAAVVENCVFDGNFSSLGAGALYLQGFGRVENSIFVNNRSENGGAIFVESTGELINCTIVNNSATGAGGGVWGSPWITNCIFWGNTAFSGSQIFGSNPSMTSIVQGGWPGANLNIPDPGFKNSINDFRLLSTSLALDAGIDSAVRVTFDVDGNARQLDANGDGADRVDIGAYEYGVVNRIKSVAADTGQGNVVRFEGTPTLTYTIERSTNLEDWDVIGTMNFTDPDFEFTDTNVPDGGTVYYRTRLP